MSTGPLNVNDERPKFQRKNSNIYLIIRIKTGKALNMTKLEHTYSQTFKDNSTG